MATVLLSFSSVGVGRLHHPDAELVQRAELCEDMELTISSKIGTSLRVNQILHHGQCITSTNGRFTLVMRTDGNLSYRNSDNRACFSSGTGGRRDEMVYVNPLT